MQQDTLQEAMRGTVYWNKLIPQKTKNISAGVLEWVQTVSSDKYTHEVCKIIQTLGEKKCSCCTFFKRTLHDIALTCLLSSLLWHPLQTEPRGFYWGPDAAGNWNNHHLNTTPGTEKPHLRRGKTKADGGEGMRNLEKQVFSTHLTISPFVFL